MDFGLSQFKPACCSAPLCHCVPVLAMSCLTIILTAPASIKMGPALHWRSGPQRLRVMPPAPDCAKGQTRTDTLSERILSPSRLPIPPPWRDPVGNRTRYNGVKGRLLTVCIRIHSCHLH